MSPQIDNVVYTASWRDFIFANFSEGSFSTATLDFVNRGAGGSKQGRRRRPLFVLCRTFANGGFFLTTRRVR